MQIDLYCDADRRVRVPGKNNSLTIDVPDAFQNDIWSVRVWPLQTRADGITGNPPYDYFEIAATTLELYIADPGASSYLTQQFTWAINGDPASPFFYADLPFNTPNIADAMTAAASDRITTTIQIRHIDGTGNPRTILFQPITIFESVANAGALVAPPGQTVLTQEVADAIYIKRTIVGHITWVCDSDPTKQRDMFIDTDGSRRDDLLP